MERVTLEGKVCEESKCVRTLGDMMAAKNMESSMTSSEFGLTVSLKGSYAASVTPQCDMWEVVEPLRGGSSEK